MGEDEDEDEDEDEEAQIQHQGLQEVDDDYYEEEEEDIAQQRRMMLSGSSGPEMSHMHMEQALHEIDQQPDHHIQRSTNQNVFNPLRVASNQNYNQSY